METTDHAGYVTAWMKAAAAGASTQTLIGLFETAWGTLWRRSESAVGRIALEAVAELVRSMSVEKHPILSGMVLESPDASLKGLEASAQGPNDKELRAALSFVLAQFLTVVGDLTDQILTPGLHAALARVAPGVRVPPAAEKKSPAAPVKPTAPAKAKETPMTINDHLIPTGIPNLDAMLSGGLIKGSSTALAGPPGSGKTVLAQQIAFHQASAKKPVIFFSTLSEPGTKSLFYLNRFEYFDQKKVDDCIHFVDLGVLLRAQGLAQTLPLILEHVKKIKPALVVVDSFKVFEDLAESTESLRKFSYELVVNLMARNCTTLLLGEYIESEYERSPLFSIIDGLISMTQRQSEGEQQRFLRIVKMRGLNHSRDEHSFRITGAGVKIFSSRMLIQRQVSAERTKDEVERRQIGIPKLDELLGGGVPVGSSMLVSGVAGTGKTVLGMEFVYRGALAGEKGIFFSFEETEERLLAAGRGLGWDLDKQVERGLLKIVFIPQPVIFVEHHLLMMQEQIKALGAKRVVVDSLSVFLHKITDKQTLREKVFQVASIVQNARAVGFFSTDVPYGSAQISRFGVEETVVDGVIILSATEESLERQRYIEIYKLRNSAHLKGRHNMSIDKGGVRIFPRYRPQEQDVVTAPPAKALDRLSTGIAELDAMLGAGLLARSVTILSGSSGIGKSILALQFLLEGAAKREPGLFVTLEESPEEIIANAAALGLPLRKAVDDGLVEIVYLPPSHMRGTQFLAVLSDKIQEKKAKRLALDSTTHVVASGMPPADVRELLYDLVTRFKTLGVTSMFTLESDSLYSMENTTDTTRGFSPLSDNVVMLRYVPGEDKMRSALMVVKTRGSAHDNSLYSFTIGKGGLRIGKQLRIPDPGFPFHAQGRKEGGTDGFVSAQA